MAPFVLWLDDKQSRTGAEPTCLSTGKPSDYEADLTKCCLGDSTNEDRFLLSSHAIVVVQISRKAELIPEAPPAKVGLLRSARLSSATYLPFAHLPHMWVTHRYENDWFKVTRCITKSASNRICLVSDGGTNCMQKALHTPVNGCLVVFPFFLLLHLPSCCL